MGCFRTGVRPVEQLSFETRLKRDELDCFGVGGLFCVKGVSERRVREEVDLT